MAHTQVSHVHHHITLPYRLGMDGHCSGFILHKGDIDLCYIIPKLNMSTFYHRAVDFVFGLILYKAVMWW